MDAHVRDLLRIANPWLDDPSLFPSAAAHRIPEPFILRSVPEATGWPVPRKAHLLLGARQVGKSSFLWKWLETRKTAPLFIDAAEPSMRGWLASATEVRADLARLVDDTTPILVDEVQHLADAGLLLKGLVDAGLPNLLLVTGSSSYHLKARTRESLAGRAVRAQMHPLSLVETAGTLPPLPPELHAARLREQATRHAVQGGYPEAWAAADAGPVLTQLVEAFVLRDASDLFQIQHLDAFRRLLLLVAGQVGSLVNVSEWASHCAVSRDTVQSYLDILVDTQVLHAVSPYSAGKRAELTRRPKYYFCDNGIRNAVARQLQPFEERLDRGALLENLVAAELRKLLSPLHPMDSLRYWRSSSGAEVDFVLERPDGVVGVEVKASPLTRPELSRSARSFIEGYRPKRFVVINLLLHTDGSLSQTPVSWRTAESLATPVDLGL